MVERQALRAVIPPDPGYHYDMAQSRVRHLEHQLEALDKADGWSVLRVTLAGEAAIAWTGVVGERARLPGRAEHARIIKHISPHSLRHSFHHGCPRRWGASP